MKTRSNAHYGLAACSLAFFPLAVQAQNNDVDEGGTTTASLNPVVVTATLAPRTVDESLSSVTVIDEDALRRQDPADIRNMFRGQPGINVTSNGSFGKSGSVSIRGVGDGGTALLIDGIRLRSATSGGAAWQFLDPRMFQSAEIVRGPRSSLYGADAMGGVVQLFTPEGEPGAPRPYASVGAGNHETWRASAGISGGKGGTRYSFAGSRLATTGAPVRRDGDDKGYDNTTGFVRLSHTFDGGGEVGLLGLRAEGGTEYSNGETDFGQQVAAVYGEVPISDNWRSRLTLSEARDESDNYDTDGGLLSILNTRTRTTRWENTFALGPHELVAGVEHSRDRVSGDPLVESPTDNYEENTRDNAAAFAQILMDFSPFAVQAGVRHDNNEAYGRETTGNLALGYELDGHHTARASYGSAFRAPTFNDLYWPFQDFGAWGTYEGNPDLRAETSKSVEVGIRGQYRRHFWDVAIYQTVVDDLIATETINGDMTRTNIDRARMRGIELAAGTESGDWKLQAAFTHLNPESRSGANRGNYLPRRATESLRLDVDRELGDWSLGGSLIAESRRYNDSANEERLSGYGLLNLRASWAFAPQWSARLTVDNVFDREYETAKDYANAGRTVFLSLNYGGW